MTVLPRNRTVAQRVKSIGEVAILGIAAALIAMALARFVKPAATSSDVMIPPNSEIGTVAMDVTAPPGALVTVTEFVDYECPVCRRYSSSLDSTLRASGVPHRLRVVMLPLPGHTSAKPAALAAICAERVGALEAMHNALFSEGQLLKEQGWTKIALKAGVQDTAQFASCLRSVEAQTVLSRHLQLAAAVKIQATPTLVVDGRVLMGAVRPKVLVAALQQAAQVSRQTGYNVGRALADAAGVPNAVVIFANPANCAINSEWAAAVNDASQRAHLRGMALVTGLSEQRAAEQAVRDLGLNFEVRIVSDSLADILKRSAGIPVIAVVRSGQTVLMANGPQFELAYRWLSSTLGVSRSGNQREAITQ